MKKVYALLLMVLMLFSLTACSSVNENSSSLSAPPLISTTDESLTSSDDSSVDNSTNGTSQTAPNSSSMSESSSDTSSSATESSQPKQSSSTPQSSSIPQSPNTSQSSSSLQSSSAPQSSSTPQFSSTSQFSSSPQSSSTSQSSSAPKSSSTPQSSSIPQSSLPPQTQPEPKTPKILVAYFSATNTTKGVAQRISDALNADLYEITPAVPYTSADLNYHDDNSRSTIEMNDLNSRPEISGSVSNMEQYDIVFIGYPIWWAEAPRILNTFVESYSFSGKTVVPFCTSGGSGVGSSARNLERLANGGQWLSGTRLNGSASKTDIVRWINGLGLDITAE